MNVVNRRDSNLPLAVGLVLSVILHAAVIVPLLMMAFTSPGPGSRMQAGRFKPEDFRPPEKEQEESPPPEVELGIDADTPSTLTWVGYEEYQRHLAALAEFEQAAFTDEPLGGGPPEAASARQAEPPEATQENLAEQAEEAPPPASEALGDDVITAIRNWLDTFAGRAEPEPDEPTDTPGEAETTDPLARWLQRIEAITRQAQTRRDEPAEPEVDRPNEEELQKPAPEPARAEPGEHADKESDPTSTVEVPLDDIELGRPIARPGLEVKPRRPQFTELILLTASPGNPLVEIRFGADGRPAQAGIIESSGDDRVDHAVEASLYRWRASGKALADLEGEQTINVRIRIILNPHATKKPEG
jgi:hypothetical protein